MSFLIVIMGGDAQCRGRQFVDPGADATSKISIL
jgi:hypothetical protein